MFTKRKRCIQVFLIVLIQSDCFRNLLLWQPLQRLLPLPQALLHPLLVPQQLLLQLPLQFLLALLLQSVCLMYACDSSFCLAVHSISDLFCSFSTDLCANIVSRASSCTTCCHTSDCVSFFYNPNCCHNHHINHNHYFGYSSCLLISFSHSSTKR